jgi:hypothetical protein
MWPAGGMLPPPDLDSPSLFLHQLLTGSLSIRNAKGFEIKHFIKFLEDESPLIFMFSLVESAPV